MCPPASIPIPSVNVPPTSTKMRQAAVNMLTNPQLDPFGKIPEFKFCAAKLEAVSPEAAE